jgi:hypothetical protein
VEEHFFRVSAAVSLCGNLCRVILFTVGYRDLEKSWLLYRGSNYNNAHWTCHCFRLMQPERATCMNRVKEGCTLNWVSLKEPGC